MTNASPDLRRSFSGQDAAQTCAERAVRFRPRRSIVRSLTVAAVPAATVAPLVVEHHYLHSMPPAAVACFGVFHDGDLCGAVVVSAGARHAHRLLAGATQNTVATLARLWLDDSLPKNSESRVLAISVRLLARTHGIRALLSYADPAVGHIGTIYQAAGWSYLGQNPPARYVDFGDGTLHHPRSTFTTYGTSSPFGLRARGLNAKGVSVPGKHRYCLVIDPMWAWRLTARGLPYPKRQRNAEPVP